MANSLRKKIIPTMCDCELTEYGGMIFEIAYLIKISFAFLAMKNNHPKNIVRSSGEQLYRNFPEYETVP